MILKATLSSTSIQKMADDLLIFRDTFKEQVKLFRETLASKGIMAARASVSGNGYGRYITFSKEDSENTTTVIATETTQIVSSWLKYNRSVSALVSPLLMAEFGAGPHAIPWEDSQGGEHYTLPDGTKIGRGEFPEQPPIYPGPTHSFQGSWFYMDESGNWQQASGAKPTRPMYNAVIEIITQVENVAREVFRYG